MDVCARAHIELDGQGEGRQPPQERVLPCARARVREGGVIDSTGSDCGNMIIHGDNLEALKALLPRFEGKVDCIYIDPLI